MDPTVTPSKAPPTAPHHLHLGFRGLPLGFIATPKGLVEATLIDKVSLARITPNKISAADLAAANAIANPLVAEILKVALTHTEYCQSMTVQAYNVEYAVEMLARQIWEPRKCM